MTLCLNKTQMQSYTGDIPMTKETLTSSTLHQFHTSSQTLPLPAHAFPKHLHHVIKDYHHLYFLSTRFSILLKCINICIYYKYIFYK